MNKFNASFVEHAREGDEYRVVISANNDEGLPASELKRLDTSRYMKNPVVLWQHDMFNGLPVGKTSKLERTANNSLVANFKFLEGDEQASRVKNAWDQGFLGAASLGWKYKDQNGERIPVLLEWSIVTVPRDSDALRACIDPKHFKNGDNKNQTLEDLSMGELDDFKKGILDEVKGLFSENQDKQNLAAFGEKIITGVDKLITARFKSFEETRKAEAEEARKKQEQQNQQTASEEKIRKEAERRANLLASVKGLLPDGFDIEKASIRDILNAALGDEAKKYEGKTDDYVEAVLDSVLANRSKAGVPGTLPHVASPGPVGVHNAAMGEKPLSTMELRNLAKQPLN